MTASLSSVLQVAQAERDRTLADVQRAEAHWRRAQAQAEQLRAYRAEYQQRWAAQFARGGRPEIVAHWRSFTERLDEAVAAQHGAVAAAQAQCEHVRTALVQAEMRVAAVSRLIERRQGEQRRVLALREQRQIDEQAQQLRRRMTPIRF